MKRERSVLENCVSGSFGLTIGCALIWKIFREVMKRDNQKNNEITSYYRILNQWLVLKQDKKTVVNFFENNNYKTVAIYGMKEMTERLLDDLENTGIVVKCIIDRNAVVTDKCIPLLHPSDSIPDVDVVVVIPSYYFGKIKSKLKGKVRGDIVSIDDVVYSKY